MIGVFLAITVPALVAGVAARGAPELEATGVRPIALADAAYAVAACGGVAVCAAALHAVGLADAGLAAARATLVYLGLMLLAVPFWGWRLAPVLPALFLLAVAVFGAWRGHRAPGSLGVHRGCRRRSAVLGPDHWDHPRGRPRGLRAGPPLGRDVLVA